jgi:hypothetical protein
MPDWQTGIMIETARHIAFLAPVPLQHLVSGRPVSAAEGRVAFGSRAWEVFRELETSQKGQPLLAQLVLLPSVSEVTIAIFRILAEPRRRNMVFSMSGW